ncbi:tetratricopeptide repeat protein [Labrys portucalensis]|uniref:Tetratricopeptide repeat protein n=1 Tax=Labrys neptuniae TaxID=376174 RepID=A0ABV6ZQN8_9HYPH
MGSSRHLLVIASQCEAEGSLTSLHSTAYALAETLRDDLRGHCGIDGSTGVLLDGDRETTERAVAQAAVLARDKVLVLVWIGHGRAHDQRYYLMPFGARAETIETSGIELVSLLGTIRKEEPSGVVLAIDACQSGTALVSALRAWVQSQGPAVPIAILTATGEAAAFDLSFSKALTELLYQGIGDADRELSCAILRDRLCEITGKQTAHLVQYDGAPLPTQMWIGHNIAFNRKGLSRAPDLREQGLVLSQAIKSLARRLATESSSLAFMADAGVGKTTLSAMLVQMPDALRAITGHQNLIDASFFATEDTTYFKVVQALADQLALYKGFRDAAQLFLQRSELPDQERMLLGPLRAWVETLDTPIGKAKITLLLDSVDSIGLARPRVLRLLESLADVPGIRVLLTGRSGVETPANIERCDLARLTDEEVRNYLSKVGVDPQLHDVLVDRIKGNWLCAAVFGEEVKAREIRGQAEIVDLTLERAFEDRLERLGVCIEDPENPAGPLTILFMTLAAAGAGAVMPSSLLRAACAAQGHIGAEEQLDKDLKKLAGLVAHGTTRETAMWGLFHQELVDYVRRSTKYRTSIVKAHAAIVDVLQIRVPNRGCAVPIEWRYAFDRELDHRSELGKLTGQINRFTSIMSSDPTDNRSFWVRLNQALKKIQKSDHPDVLRTEARLANFEATFGSPRAARDLLALLLPDMERVLGAGHRDVLKVREDLASWTGASGDAKGACDQIAVLLETQEKMLGADDRDTLRTRATLALWTGKAGNAGAARDLYVGLLADQERVLGADHPDTLMTRSNIANWVGECGDAPRTRDLFISLQRDLIRVRGADDREALRLRGTIAYWTGMCGDSRTAREMYASLLFDQERILGANDREAMQTRASLAHWIAECGDPQTGREMYAALLLDEERWLGADDLEVLQTRANLARWTGECGDPRAARDLFSKLLPDRERVRGADSLDALETRDCIAYWTGQCGDAHATRDLYAELLPDQERVLGADHPDTLITRENIAGWTGRCGAPRTARDLFATLLPDQQRVCGLDHPYVLRARRNLAYWTGECGDASAARDLYADLLLDQQRIYGTDHPDVLRTRDNIASWTAQCDDIEAALNLYAGLLQDQERVLGPNHPDTLATRHNVADCTGQSGDPSTARDLLARLLPDQRRVLGDDHFDVLRTWNNLAHWTGRCGDACAARDLFTELLSDQRRVRGTDHPDVLTIRHNLAHWTGECGDPRAACDLFVALLGDHERLLGADHPKVLKTRSNIAKWTGKVGDAGEASI